MDRISRQLRAVQTRFDAREDAGEPHISGYFAVYDTVYEICPGMSESIAPGAFSRTLQGGDIRALINHETTFVLGRTKAHTLELHEDARGLWGSIAINPNDSDAMNLYERVKRGDVDQCSFGFMIVSEESDFREDGTVHWTIKDVDLFEVSACTFPAYEETSLSARTSERAELEARRLAVWKERAKNKLHGGEQ